MYTINIGIIQNILWRRNCDEDIMNIDEQIKFVILIIIVFVNAYQEYFLHNAKLSIIFDHVL